MLSADKVMEISDPFGISSYSTCFVAGGRVIVATHGGTIRSLYMHASPNGRPGKVLNASISIFHIADGGIWSLKTWNDVSHLNQTRLLKSGFGGDAISG